MLFLLNKNNDTIFIGKKGKRLTNGISLVK